MSCCGSRRAQWAQEQARSGPPASAPAVDRSETGGRPARIFEYSGTGALTVRGAVSGAVYRFDRRGARVEVQYEDSFALMAEPELKLTAGQ